MKKPLAIDFDFHAVFRLAQRSIEFGLTYEQARERTLKTVQLGHLAKRKHLSKYHKTYYHYFGDNLSFYVICKEIDSDKPTTHLIKTVIIEMGRE